MSEVIVLNLFVSINVDGEVERAPIQDQSYEDIVQVFRQAILNGDAVRFIYRKDEDEVPEIRTLTPSSLEATTADREIVCGHDHDRDFARCFRLDRISAVDIAQDVEPYVE